ncbi:MAG: hypothetical protein ACLFPP_07485 [Spirochaetaceae bacterium]
MRLYLSPHSKPLRRASLLITAVFFASALSPVTAQEEGLYRSNEQFLPIEPIGEGERSEYTYVMRVTVSDRGTERELFRNGELYRVRIETEGADGLPREITTSDAEGTLLEARWYRYDRQRRLRGVEVVGIEEESRFLSGIPSGEAGLTEEVLEEGNESERVRAVFRYDEAGRLIGRSRYRDGELIEEVSQEFSGGAVRLRTEEYPRERRRVVTVYNEQGFPVEEEQYEAGRLVSRIEKSYDDEGRVVRELVEERESRELLYSYGEEGELTREEELLNGTLYRRTRYEPGDRRVEIRFRRGEPFLRTYFEGDSRLREEVLQNGRIVEVRRFGEEDSGEE